MTALRILVLVTLTAMVTSEATHTQETERRNKIRFPDEGTEQMEVESDMFGSESQHMPIVIQTTSGTKLPHYVIPKPPKALQPLVLPLGILQNAMLPFFDMPLTSNQPVIASKSNPFGSLNTKGFSDGLLVPFYQDGDFHQTVPPPLQATPYAPPNGLKVRPTSNFNGPNRPIHQNDRFRYSSPDRVPLGHPSKPKYKPNPGSYGHYSPYRPQIKYTKPENTGKFPKYSSGIDQSYTRNKPETNYNTPESKRPHVFPGSHHKGSSSSFEQNSSDENEQNTSDELSNQGYADWQIKFQDTPANTDVSSLYKKNKQRRPSSEYNYHNFPEKYSFNDGPASSSLHSFEDFAQYQNKFIDDLNSNKYLYPNRKYKTRGQVSPGYKSVYHQNNKYKPISHESHHQSGSAEGSASLEEDSNERPNDYDHQENTFSKSQDTSTSHFGTDWIPINAPSGVPARSYEIPAPDLSGGNPYFETKRRYRPEEKLHSQDKNLVYGHPIRSLGPSSDEDRLVSAVVRVKQ